MTYKANGIEEYRMMMLNIIKAIKENETITTKYNKDDDIYIIIVKGS